MGKIKVHEKALAHLSRGLYRSPASALRELTSNAWDASATVVRIDTGAPNFAQLSVQDNGKGFTEAEFIELMEGGIGNSEKRASTVALVNDRPVIGRLGIGMLGIAQITGNFTVTSKTADGKGFRARINLYDLMRPKLDRDDEQVVRDLDTVDGVREVDVGEYEILKDFDPTPYKVGTTILTNDVHPAFVQSFRETYREPPRDWAAFIEESTKLEPIQAAGDYWRLLWELGASCPVAYVSPAALPNRLVAADHQRLEAFDFKVLVDGIELKKPVHLAGHKAGYTTLRIENTLRKVFGQEIAFHGYIAVQEGKQITPDELRGIMIRIREVGIGLYDRSLLDYRSNEGPRSRWITGEIYVDKGLEDALNIDRDSFNRFHPEFRLVQKHVHEALQKDVFPRVYKQIDVRSNAKRDEREQVRTKALRAVLAEDEEAEVKVRKASNLTAEEVMEETLVQQSGKVVEVFLPPPEAMQTKKPHRFLAAALLAIYDVTQRVGSPHERRRAFIERVLSLLAKW